MVGAMPTGGGLDMQPPEIIDLMMTVIAIRSQVEAEALKQP